MLRLGSPRHQIARIRLFPASQQIGAATALLTSSTNAAGSSKEPTRD